MTDKQWSGEELVRQAEVMGVAHAIRLGKPFSAGAVVGFNLQLRDYNTETGEVSNCSRKVPHCFTVTQSHIDEEAVTDKYWLVSKSATVRVLVTDDVITEAAPLVRRFTGQPLPNLFRWFRGTFGDFQLECEYDIVRPGDDDAPARMVLRTG